MNTAEREDTIWRLQNLMRYTYGIVPIVAGLDKFTDKLTMWDNYLNPTLAKILPFPAHIFMMIVGVIEIIAGIIVLAKPRVGSIIVMIWLILIAISLISYLSYLDVAVRDLVMAIGAYTLSQLSALVVVPEQIA